MAANREEGIADEVLTKFWSDKIRRRFFETGGLVDEL